MYTNYCHTCRFTNVEQRQYEKKRADEVFSTLLRAKRLAKRRAQEIANRVEVCYWVYAYNLYVATELPRFLYLSLLLNRNSGKNQREELRGMR